MNHSDLNKAAPYVLRFEPCLVWVIVCQGGRAIAPDYRRFDSR